MYMWRRYTSLFLLFWGAQTSIGMESIEATLPACSAQEILIKEKVIRMTKEPSGAIFSPPKSWAVVDPTLLPGSVKLMAVTDGLKEFPPSINLASERFSGTLADYLKTIKEINKSQGGNSRSLGTLQTTAGKASLLQCDTSNEWGEVRRLHIVFQKNKHIYIMTAAALKEEFPEWRTVFLDSFKTFSVNDDAFTMVQNPERREKLENNCKEVLAAWKKLGEDLHTESGGDVQRLELFSNTQFQSNSWEPFTKLVAQEFDDMDPVWQDSVIQDMLDEMLDGPNLTNS